MLKKRAARWHGGNLSAVIAEGVALLRQEEGRQALVAWLGGAARTTPELRASVRAEWRDDSNHRRRGRVA